MRYKIQVSILMLLPNIKKLASWFPRKMWRKLSCEQICRCPQYWKSRQTGSDMRQIQNCVTRYSSPYWCFVPNIRKLASVVPEKNVTVIILWANLSMSKLFKVASNRKWTCRRFKNALHDTVLHTDTQCQLSGSWPLWFPRKMWQKLSCEQICLCR